MKGWPDLKQLVWRSCTSILRNEQEAAEIASDVISHQEVKVRISFAVTFKLLSELYFGMKCRVANVGVCETGLKFGLSRVTLRHSHTHIHKANLDLTQSTWLSYWIVWPGGVVVARCIRHRSAPGSNLIANTAYFLWARNSHTIALGRLSSSHPSACR